MQLWKKEPKCHKDMWKPQGDHMVIFLFHNALQLWPFVVTYIWKLLHWEIGTKIKVQKTIAFF
jgi:hypothetical protein